MMPSTVDLPIPSFALGDRSEAARRLLLISYHFPPSPEAGALRWQKMAAVFAERGWALDVIARDPLELRRTEPDRLGELPPGIRVFGVGNASLLAEKAEHAVWTAYRRLRPELADRPRAAATPGGSPTRAARPDSLRKDEARWNPWRLRGWLRTYYAWREYAKDGDWSRRAAGLALQLADQTRYHGIITCGPPHLVHEGGRLVSQATGLPLIVDMRDPWRLQPRLTEYLASPLWHQLADRYEKRIVARAALVVMNTASAAEAMSRIYPGSRVIPVLNGYDDDPLPPTPRRERFMVAYAGAIYLDRDPRLLFRAAARVIRELTLPAASIGFEFIGSAGAYGGTSLQQMALEEGIAGYVAVGPSRSRQAAHQFLAGASMLVSLPQDSILSIPSKVFEYMRFDAWLLALADRDSATERLLRGSGADVVAPHDVEGMAAALRTRYAAFARGERPNSLASDPTLSRRYQAGLFCDALEDLLAHHSHLVQSGSDQEVER